MNTLAEDRGAPKGPKFPHVVAVVLELSMLATFIANRSIVGILLAFAYAWFSATWAMFFDACQKDE
jgi:hypothetical protein